MKSTVIAKEFDAEPSAAFAGTRFAYIDKDARVHLITADGTPRSRCIETESAAGDARVLRRRRATRRDHRSRAVRVRRRRAQLVDDRAGEARAIAVRAARRRRLDRESHRRASATTTRASSSRRSPSTRREIRIARARRQRARHARQRLDPRSSCAPTRSKSIEGDDSLQAPCSSARRASRPATRAATRRHFYVGTQHVGDYPRRPRSRRSPTIRATGRTVIGGDQTASACSIATASRSRTSTKYAASAFDDADHLWVLDDHDQALCAGRYATDKWETIADPARVDGDRRGRPARVLLGTDDGDLLVLDRTGKASQRDSGSRSVPRRSSRQRIAAGVARRPARERRRRDRRHADLDAIARTLAPGRRERRHPGLRRDGRPHAAGEPLRAHDLGPRDRRGAGLRISTCSPTSAGADSSPTAGSRPIAAARPARHPARYPAGRRDPLGYRVPRARSRSSGSRIEPASSHRLRIGSIRPYATQVIDDDVGATTEQIDRQAPFGDRVLLVIDGAVTPGRPAARRRHADDRPLAEVRCRDRLGLGLAPPREPRSSARTSRSRTSAARTARSSMAPASPANKKVRVGDRHPVPDRRRHRDGADARRLAPRDARRSRASSPRSSNRPRASRSASSRPRSSARPASARSASPSASTRCRRAAAAPFVRINCAAISEPLLEAELFGNEATNKPGLHRVRRRWHRVPQRRRRAAAVAAGEAAARDRGQRRPPHRLGRRRAPSTSASSPRRTRISPPRSTPVGSAATSTSGSPARRSRSRRCASARTRSSRSPSSSSRRPPVRSAALRARRRREAVARAARLARQHPRAAQRVRARRAARDRAR